MLACSRQPSSSSSTSSRSRSFQGHQKKGGTPISTPKNHKFRKFSELLKDLAKAKCSQTNYFNYLGASLKVGLAILKAQYGIRYVKKNVRGGYLGKNQNMLLFA